MRRRALMASKALRHAHPATLEQKVAQLAGEAMGDGAVEERRQIATLWSELRSCSRFRCHETMELATTAATAARTVAGSAVSPPYINAAISAGKGHERGTRRW